MATLRVPVGLAVDAVQRIAFPVVFGDGHPNYPAWQTQTGGEWHSVDPADATHAAWDDHRLNERDRRLCEAIAADPTRIPDPPPSPLTRTVVDSWYPGYDQDPTP